MRPVASATVSSESQCHLVFTGLERTGHDLRKLTVAAHFGVDTKHKAARTAGPIQASTFYNDTINIIVFHCCERPSEAKRFLIPPASVLDQGACIFFATVCSVFLTLRVVRNEQDAILTERSVRNSVALPPVRELGYR